MNEISHKNIELYKKTALVWKEGSTCARLKVGCCIFNKAGRCVITSYNGTISEMINCNEIFDITNLTIDFDKWHQIDQTINKRSGKMVVSREEFMVLHHNFSEKYEIHAEMNAILNLNKTNSNVNLSDCSIMITTQPCVNCMKLIAASGIKTVYYLEKYDRNNDNEIDMLSEALGLKMIKV